MTLETGIRGEQSVPVTAENTAKTMGSGTLDVFATPALVALAEKTCWMSVEGRKLTFKVSLHDEKGPVGGGTHERFVIHNDKFAAKAEAKKG